MKLVLIRHSKAIDKSEWVKASETRPLSREGVNRAEYFAKQLVKFYSHNVDYLISSERTRARETAEIIRKNVKPRHFFLSPQLNPGHGIKSLREILEKIPSDSGNIMIVGHFPEIGGIADELTGRRNKIIMRKPSLVELETTTGSDFKITRNFSYDDEKPGVLSPFRKAVPSLGEVQIMEI